MNDSFETFTYLGIALGLGLLVGLQRERTESSLAGFRTFPLITVFGTICGLLTSNFGVWVVPAGLLALAGLIVIADARRTGGPADPGMTSEVAMLVMFGVGALLVTGATAVAVALGGGVAVLLQLKPEMHALAAKIGDRDFKAVIQLALISMVILPVLPNEAYGPFKVLNPYKIWLMVVLIVGLSLVGYAVYKFFGDKLGTLAAGVIGGFISSTATTVTYARRTRESPGSGGLASVVIMLASSVVYLRVLIIIAATNAAMLKQAAAPIGVMFGVTVAIAIGTWLMNRRDGARVPEPSNPAELKAAMIFGGLFALALLGTAAGKHYFGNSGLVAVALLSGLTDMDAITLSLSQMMMGSQIDPNLAWKLIVAASLSNFAFKSGIALLQGDRKFALRTCLLFGSAAVAGLLVIFVWR